MTYTRSRKGEEKNVAKGRRREEGERENKRDRANTLIRRGARRKGETTGRKGQARLGGSG